MASGSFQNNYRGYTVRTDWSSTPNVAGNYSDITFKHYLICANTYSLGISSRTNICNVDGTPTYFTSPKISTSGNETIEIGTTTHRVYHDSDGEKEIYTFTVFYIKATISGVYVESIIADANIKLDDIPREANIISAPNFNDEQNPTINYSNPAGDIVESLKACISLNDTSEDILYRDIPKNGTSYTFNLTEEERNILRNATTDNNERTVIFFIETVLGDETYYSTKEVKFNIVNANPTNGTFTYKDSKASTVEITEDDQRIIRNNSNLLFTLGAATSKKGATIKKYEITFNGVTKSRTTAGDLDFGTINLSSNATATLKVTDSRGNYSTKEITVIIDDWVLPTGIISLNRKNNFYSETYIKVDGTYSSLNSKNTMSIVCKYKKTTEETYISTNLNDNVQSTLDLDNNYQWNIIVIVSDKLGTTNYNLTLDRGMPIIFFDRLLASVGINSFPTLEQSLEVVGSFLLNNKSIVDIIYPVGSIYMSVYSTEPSINFGGTWEQITDSNVSSIGYIWKRTK